MKAPSSDVPPVVTLVLLGRGWSGRAAAKSVHAEATVRRMLCDEIGTGRGSRSRPESSLTLIGRRVLEIGLVRMRGPNRLRRHSEIAAGALMLRVADLLTVEWCCHAQVIVLRGQGCPGGDEGEEERGERANADGSQGASPSRSRKSADRLREHGHLSLHCNMPCVRRNTGACERGLGVGASLHAMLVRYRGLRHLLHLDRQDDDLERLRLTERTFERYSALIYVKKDITMRPSLFDHEEISVRADAARDMIDARLKLLPEGELRNFWGLVAQVYARSSTGSVPLAETAIVPTPAA